MKCYIPKVTIKSFDNKKSWVLESNIFPLDDRIDSENNLISQLLDLCDEYLQYCIGMIEHGALPFMGKNITGGRIERKLLPFLRDNSISTGDYPDPIGKKTREVFLFDINDMARVKNTLDSTLRLLQISDSLSEAILGSIVGNFEFYAKKTVELYARIHKDKFINKQDDIKLGYLMSVDSIDTVINEKIHKKIQEKMRGSHSDIIEWLADIFDSGDISSIKSSLIYKDFLEACQRRHILIHNGGIVNDLYINNCKSFGMDINNLPKIDEKISVTPNYIKKVSGRSFLIYLYIIHMYIQKNGSTSDKLNSLKSLLSTSHSFLLSKQTKMCRRVLDFAEKNKNIPNDIKISFGINRALSYLFDPNKDKDTQTQESKKVLSQYDLSVTDPLIDLALACAKREFSDIISLAKKAHIYGVEYSTITTFVVFTEARAIPGFMDCFPKPLLRIAPR